MTTELVNVNEVQNQFAKLRKAYKKALPRVEPMLLNDILEKEAANMDTANHDDVGLPYTSEAFTRGGVDKQTARHYILDKTGVAPAIFDNGTHLVTNQKLTIAMSEEIFNSSDVMEVPGSFCGGLGMKGAYLKRRH